VAIAPYLAAIGVGVVGVIIARVGTRRSARDAGRLTTDIRAIEEHLERITAEADRLEAEKAGIDVYDLRHRIDERFREELEAFVQARESIAHSFGLQAYAEVMTHFAAGERSLNRVWSASTDGYIDEAHEYIRRAREHFREALERFRAVRAAARTAPVNVA